MKNMDCKICNFETPSQRVFIHHIKKEHKIESLEKYLNEFENLEKKKCQYCGHDSSFDQKNRIYRNVCPNRKCIARMAKAISDKKIKEKYGVDNVFRLKETKDKVSRTKKEKYNDKNYNNPEKNKITCLKKYGVNNGSKIPEIKERISQKYFAYNNNVRIKKIIETFKNNYNVEWNSKDPEICKKIHSSLRLTNEKNIGSKIKEMNFSILKTSSKGYDLECNACHTKKDSVKNYLINYHYRTDKHLCLKCYPYEKFRSSGEKELGREIQKIYSGEMQFNKKLFGYEADIFIPEKKLIFEYNGIYWHSELYKDKNYHKDKKEKFSRNGYKVIYIWEDDWNNEIRRNIILSRIKSVFQLNNRIYARNCEIREIDNKASSEFLIKNHLKGNIASQIKIGLFYKDNLVCLSTFGKRKILNKEESFELLRNCSLREISVIGGFSKIINYFVQKYGNNLFSYVDADWSDFKNNSYNNSNFEFISYSNPNYYWVINNQRKNRVGFQKHKLVKNGADPLKSETEIMHELGFYRVYDSGTLKYRYKQIKDI
jgi:very-short-patch-repair endonuclease